MAGVRRDSLVADNEGAAFPCGVLYTMTYTDLAQFDAERFSGLLSRSRVNMLMVDVVEHAGGYALYPSAHAPHHPLLADRDVFGELVQACDGLRIDVYARVLGNFLEESVALRRPEMLARNAEGRIWQWQTHNADVPGFWRPRAFTCMNSPHRRTYMAALLKELAGRYPQLRGICSDAFWQPGICHCRYCCARYAADTGSHALPLAPVAGDPAWQRYERWQAACVAEFNRWLATTTREACPHWEYLPPLMCTLQPFGSGVNAGADFQQYHDVSDTVFVELLGYFQAERHVPHVQPILDVRYASSFRKRSLCFSEFTARSPMGVWNGVANHRNEMILEAAQVIATGGSPMQWLEVDPFAYDASMFEGLGDFYAVLQRESHWYSRRWLDADVALCASMDTMHSCASGDPRTQYYPGLYGAYRALVEEHQQFHVVSEHQLTGKQGDIHQYRALILPGAAAMSDACIECLTQYVRDGGLVIATDQTSLLDEQGAARQDFGLSEMFGVSSRGPMQHPPDIGVKEWGVPVVGGYAMRVTEAAGPTASYPVGKMLPCDAYVPVTTQDTATTSARVCLPIWPFGSWPVGNSIFTDHPAIVVHRLGEGTVIYFTARVFHMYHIYGAPAVRSLLAGCLAMTKSTPLLRTNAPASVELNLFTHPDGLTVDLVNYSGVQGRPFSDIVPVRDISISVKAPVQGGSAQARALWANAPLAVKEVDGYLTVVVPTLSVFETLTLSFARQHPAAVR